MSISNKPFISAYCRFPRPVGPLFPAIPGHNRRPFFARGSDYFAKCYIALSGNPKALNPRGQGGKNPQL